MDELRSVADPSRKPGMARVGITVDRALGISIPHLRRIACGHRRDHALALDLWTTEIHEARILASMIDDAQQVSRQQMDAWAVDFDSWDLCDQVCGNLFRNSASADTAARAWARRDEEYVRRAAFSIVSSQAVHDNERADAYFLAWLPRIRRAATDDRNSVKKAVNWSLRQIGKRNLALREAAIDASESLLEVDSRSARWIARDALRELNSDAVMKRFGVH
ncbi:MAG: DNA alkylation repair protein [Actinomycetota bacterium]|nr:DNA alkylation repair protein [Actinomycetota bacterium]